MKFFWRIISTIHTQLTVAGAISSKPPAFLFHKPNINLQCCYQQLILADENFTIEEQDLIVEAVRNLEYFCNGLVRIILRFDLDPRDTETIKHHNVLLRANADYPIIIKSDETLNANTLGLCEFIENDTCRLYLSVDRLCNSHVFRTTVIHELGHFIGLEHIPNPSIMHKNNSCDVLYPTYQDAVEMARVWDMLPTDFRYFKQY